MKNEEFINMLKTMEDTEHNILECKGMEYTQSDLRTDRLANFYRLGEELNLDPKMVLWIYLKKHLDSIVCFIKQGREYSDESIEGRIHDARNYLCLLNGIITEQKGKRSE